MKLSKWLSGAMVAAGLVSAVGPAFAQEKLTVWWVKGFYKAEDDALFAAIRKFEEKNKNIKIDLSLYPIQDMIPKTVAALDSGNPPDLAYADTYDFQVTAKWAYDGKLEDVTSVIDRFVTTLNLPLCRPPSCITTKQKTALITHTPSSSKPCISSTGKTCWLNQATKNQIFQRTGTVTGTSGALRCKLVIAKKLVSVALVQAFPWASIQPTRSFLS
jgi:hypothetical protein